MKLAPNAVRAIWSYYSDVALQKTVDAVCRAEGVRLPVQEKPDPRRTNRRASSRLIQEDDWGAHFNASGRYSRQYQALKEVEALLRESEQPERNRIEREVRAILAQADKLLGPTKAGQDKGDLDVGFKKLDAATIQAADRKT